MMYSPGRMFVVNFCISRPVARLVSEKAIEPQPRAAPKLILVPCS